MDQNNFIKDLNIEKFENTHEYLSEECTRLRSILEDLGLLDLANESLEPESIKKNDDIEIQTKHTMLELKAQIQLYENLNSKLCDEIIIARREVDQSKELLDRYSVSSKEMKELKEKIEKYQKQLKKPKYPWLQDPEFNFDNILSEMEILKQLINHKNSFEEELKKEYCGLKPNLTEANQQLLDVKREYEALINEIKNRRH